VARNFAMQEVHGRYIAFLDEDDLYHPRFLEVLLRIAKLTGADVVGCEFVKFVDESLPDFAEPLPADGEWRQADGPEVVDWASRYYDGLPFEIWRNVYRREIAVGHPFPLGVRVEQDLYWIYTLLPRIHRYVRINWRGYAWRKNVTSGGFLHPDAASLISLTATDRTIATLMFDELKMSADQRRRFAKAMSLMLRWCVWPPLRDGLSLTEDESLRLRKGLKALSRFGVGLDHVLGVGSRLRYAMFLLTGSTRWISRRVVRKPGMSRGTEADVR